MAQPEGGVEMDRKKGWATANDNNGPYIVIMDVGGEVMDREKQWKQMSELAKTERS